MQRDCTLKRYDAFARIFLFIEQTPAAVKFLTCVVRNTQGFRGDGAARPGFDIMVRRDKGNIYLKGGVTSPEVDARFARPITCARGADDIGAYADSVELDASVAAGELLTDNLFRKAEELNTNVLE